jgi:hypothetical protein
MSRPRTAFALTLRADRGTDPVRNLRQRIAQRRLGLHCTDIREHTARASRRCPKSGSPRRQRFCSAGCRKSAFRAKKWPPEVVESERFAGLTSTPIHSADGVVVQVAQLRNGGAR